jgi:hypothetical protein
MASAGLVACTTFSDVSYDAGGPASDAGKGGSRPALTSYLTTKDAGILCSRAVRCPELMRSIALSIHVPLTSWQPHAYFSLCTSWLASSVSPDRPGFAMQQGMLAAMAKATTCEASVAAAFVQAAGAPCTDDVACGDGALFSCTQSGKFRIPCGTPYQPGDTCRPSAGADLCVRSASCTAGVTCSEGHSIKVCGFGVESTVECWARGQVCASGRCTDAVLPAECPESTDVTGACTGTRAVVCTSSQPQTTIDCGAAGLTCAAANGTSYCQHASDDCTPFSPGIDTCDASGRLVACVAGRRTALDCSSIGLSRCAAAPAAHCE